MDRAGSAFSGAGVPSRDGTPRNGPRGRRTIRHDRCGSGFASRDRRRPRNGRHDGHRPRNVTGSCTNLRRHRDAEIGDPRPNHAVTPRSDLPGPRTSRSRRAGRSAIRDVKPPNDLPDRRTSRSRHGRTSATRGAKHRHGLLDRRTSRFRRGRTSVSRDGKPRNGPRSRRTTRRVRGLRRGRCSGRRRSRNVRGSWSGGRPHCLRLLHIGPAIAVRLRS